ncbi:MAG: histidine phosphatase family protein, partial [Albidovulum sp.]
RFGGDFRAARRAGRFQGRLDSPLTEKGRAQAIRQGEILAKAKVNSADFQFISSPQGRARQTAKLALTRFEGVIEEDPLLQEIDVGLWQGLTNDQIAASAPGATDERDPFFWNDAAPEGEGFIGVEARVRAFLARLDRPSVVVTHGVFLRFLRGALLGLDLEEISGLQDGQGVVYRIKDGRQTRLS